MSLAFNDSGDAVYFDAGSKAWKPAPVATNPKGEKVYYDGKSWGAGPSKTTLTAGPLEQPSMGKTANELLKGVRAGLDVATGMPAESTMQGKMPPLEKGSDPMALMAQHPYVTAAATGAAMGPTFGLGPLAEVPGAAPAAGAAEQMAYQKATDVATDKLGPAAGMAVGIGLPMVSPVATALGGGRVAAKAATAAEMQWAAQAQAESMAEQKLAMTAPQAAELARPTQIDPQQAGQLSAAKNAVWGARRDALRTVGRQYDPIFQKVDEMPLTADHIDSIQKGIADARNTVAARGRSFSPGTNRLLDEIGGPVTKGKPYDTAESIRAAEGETGPQPGAPRTFVDDANAKRLLSEDLYKRKAGITATSAEPPPTIGQLRGRLARLRQAADTPGISQVERSGIFEATKPIIQVLDSVIPDEQKPILASINAQYAQVNKILPFKGMKAMNSAGTLPELGEAMFSKPNSAATSIVLGGMNDAQKGLMRDAFASWALNQKGTGKELFNLLSAQKDNLAKLGFPPELSSVGPWNDLVAGANRMKTIPGLPSQKEFMKGAQAELKASGYSQKALDAADEALRKPPSGDISLARRRLLVYAPLMAMMGYGVLWRQPEMIVPIAGLAATYMGKRAIINSPELLPAYRNFVMGGWTRGGGQQFAKMLVAATRDGVQAAAAPTLRPDKEREAEAATP